MRRHTEDLGEAGAAGTIIATAGEGGQGSVAGTEAGNPASPCDPEASATWTLLSVVEGDGCGYDRRDILTLNALGRVLSRQPPAPIPETRPFIPECDNLKLPIYRDPEDPENGRILCPGYCTLLQEWLDANTTLFLACLPDAMP